MPTPNTTELIQRLQSPVHTGLNALEQAASAFFTALAAAQNEATDLRVKVQLAEMTEEDQELREHFEAVMQKVGAMDRTIANAMKEVRDLNLTWRNMAMVVATITNKAREKGYDV